MNSNLKSIGLGGDGDEVDAIERVEKRFDIAFDHEDCERFDTVGDVWRALVKELRLSEAEAAPLWNDFVAELGDETLRKAEFGKVGLETTLLAPSLAQVLRRTAKRLSRR